MRDDEIGTEKEWEGFFFFCLWHDFIISNPLICTYIRYYHISCWPTCNGRRGNISGWHWLRWDAHCNKMMIGPFWSRIPLITIIPRGDPRDRVIDCIIHRDFPFRHFRTWKMLANELIDEGKEKDLVPSHSHHSPLHFQLPFPLDSHPTPTTRLLPSTSLHPRTYLLIMLGPQCHWLHISTHWVKKSAILPSFPSTNIRVISLVHDNPSTSLITVSISFTRHPFGGFFISATPHLVDFSFPPPPRVPSHGRHNRYDQAAKPPRKYLPRVKSQSHFGVDSTMPEQWEISS